MGSGLPIDSEAVDRAPPPLSLRTDSIGIFTVLALSGVSQFLTGPTASAAETLPQWALLSWELTLITGGFGGLASTLVPARWRVYGFAGEAIARLALGLGAAAYAAAVLNFRGMSAGFTSAVFLGISVMMLVGAVQLGLWLHRQRQVVTVVLRFQEGEAEVREGEQNGGAQ